jgi:hypothetical protein
MTRDGGRFWSGPIRNRSQAELILNWTGWVFVSLGALGLVSALMTPRAFHLRTLIPALVIALCFAAPGAYLLSRKSAAAATALLLVSVALIAVSLVSILEIGEIGIIGIPIVAVGLAVDALLITLCWRACRAARAFERFERRTQERLTAN